MEYDDLSRLKESYINGVLSKSYSYDDFGNITNKDGKTYTYGASCNGITAGPHAVTSAGSASYCYDENGNQTSGDGRSITYSTFNKPTEITKDAQKLTFNYAPSRSRYQKLIYRDNNVLKERKVTAGGVEVVYDITADTTEVRSYVGDAILKFEYQGSSTVATEKTQYLFKDHLGSTDVVVTRNGNVDTLVNMSFDAFGQRRIPEEWNGVIPTYLEMLSLLAVTDKGFTGHEQLDDVGLIHMNGRVYDPSLGRFISADPFVQAPTDTQSFNRYSYVLNNPLSATDPSGYFFKSLFKGIAKNYFLNALVGAIATAVGGPAGLAIWKAFTTYQLVNSAINMGMLILNANSESIGDFLASAFVSTVANQFLPTIPSPTTGKTTTEKSATVPVEKAGENGGGVGANRGDFDYKKDVTEGEVNRAGKAYLNMAEKNPPNSLTIDTTPVLGLNGTDTSEYLEIKSIFEDKINKQIAYLEKNGLPYQLSKVKKLYVLLDETIVDGDGSDLYGQWGPAPLHKSGHRALTINPKALSKLKGDALKLEIGETVGHELGHSFMKLRDEANFNYRDHRKIEAFGKWLNREAEK